MDIRSPGVRGSSRAFTLIELIIVLAMTSIVLSIGVPGIGSLLGSSRITSAVNTMVHHLHYARSEAVRSGFSVILCPSVAGNACDDSFHWERGFILFIDKDGNRKPGGDEKVLRHANTGNSHTSIFTSVGRKKITYQASGMAPGSTATFTVCDPDNRVAPKAVILSNPGRPRLSDTQADGSPIKCI